MSSDTAGERVFGKASARQIPIQRAAMVLYCTVAPSDA